jgi:hypothetical protein
VSRRVIDRIGWWKVHEKDTHLTRVAPYHGTKRA